MTQTTEVPALALYDAAGNYLGLDVPGGANTTAIIGTTTNDNAVAGNLGEYLTANVSIGSAVALVTNTAKSIVSLSLTSGDWDVTGLIGYAATTGTAPQYVQQGISTTDNTMGAFGTFTYDVIGVDISTDTETVSTSTVRVSLAATTTIYLIAKSTFTVSTLAAYGQIRARRAR